MYWSKLAGQVLNFSERFVTGRLQNKNTRKEIQKHLETNTKSYLSPRSVGVLLKVGRVGIELLGKICYRPAIECEYKKRNTKTFKYKHKMISVTSFCWSKLGGQVLNFSERSVTGRPKMRMGVVDGSTLNISSNYQNALFLLLHCTPLLSHFLLSVFLKHGQLDFSKAFCSIFDHLTSIFPDTF